MDRDYERLRDQVLPLLAPYVIRIRVFGSVARGDERPGSDLDLLVRLKPASDRPTLGLRWFALEQELSQLLGRPVEMVTEEALSRHVRPFVETDAVVLYEA